MSQAKVDKYKQDKKNRQQIMKKQKMERTMWKIGGSVFGLVVVGWLGFSVYHVIDNRPAPVVPAQTYEVNTDALSDYLSGLSGDELE